MIPTLRHVRTLATTLVLFGVVLVCGGGGADVVGAATNGVTYTYDAAGRLSTVTTAQGSATYNYDKAGNIVSITRSPAAAPSDHRSRQNPTVAPYVASVAPGSGRAGGRVVIAGTGFVAAAIDKVRIGNLYARVASATSTRIIAVIPPGSHGGAVTVMTPGGSSAAPTHITVPHPASAPPTSAPTPTEHTPLLRGPPGVTALTGRILDTDGNAVAGATVSIDAHRAHTDTQGRFLLTNLSSGHHELFVDARRPQSGGDHGVYEEGVDVEVGTTTTLPWTIWIPKLDVTHAITIPSPTTKPITYTSPLLPGLRIDIPVGTVIRDHWGHIVHQLSVTRIPIDRTPLPLAPGMTYFYTLQPEDSTVTGPGIRISYPNYMHAQPGAPISYLLNDASKPTPGWYDFATARVSRSGQEVDLPPHVGLHYIGFPGASPFALCKAVLGILCPIPGGSPANGDPVDLGTGLFVNTHTDLALPDVLPISVTRVYRQADNELRAFGIGQSDNLDLFVSPDNAGNYDLQLPAGGDVVYAPTGNCNFAATGTPTGFAGSTMQSGTGGGCSDRYFVITLKDGTQYTFTTLRPSLTSITDRYGNTIQISRDNGTGQIQQVTSPNGRWLSFTWGPCVTGTTPANCVTQVTDNTGRKVLYGYDGQGRLTSVTDVGGNATTYGWGACPTGAEATCTQLDTITDPRHITYLKTAYSTTDGRVAQQTLANGGLYTFSYTVASSGQVTQTSVTDPRGSVNQVDFDTSGFSTSDTMAAGTSTAETATFTRDPSTHEVTGTVDALGRHTHYVYDALGNVSSITQLYGTSKASTVSFTYESQYDRIATATDPLNRTAHFSYDDTHNTVTVTDPLGLSTVTKMVDGQPVSITDPLGHTTYLSYLYGDVVAIADPSGDVTSRYFDAAGRLLRSTDPDGNQTIYQVDPLNQVMSITDPLEHITAFAYDANGNLKSVTDPNGNTTQYTYDNMDRVATATDPLLKTAHYTYDKLGNLTKLIDRNGTSDTFTYDPLGRLSVAKYAVTSSGSESKTTYKYDLGNRLRTVTDSPSGTYTQTFDGLDHLVSQTSPTGTVSYTYNGAGLRHTMTVAGQPTVTYGYDADNRLQTISNGAQTVSMAYDAADRQTSITLPDGIQEAYAYDPAGRPTDVTYTNGTTTLGDLTYGYDANGNRTSVGGSFANVDLPSATTTDSTFNGDNELTSFNGTTFTYDADGNLETDGTNSYAWNARDQLTGISGSVSASFSYDPFGRRLQKTVSSLSTGFVYDGANIVQEESGGSPTANELTGLGTDQTFSRTDSSGTSSLLTDPLNSTIALGNGSGTVSTTYSYTPFGVPTASGTANSNPFQFTGRESDGTGLQYNRARYYSPTTGRFISPDPLSFGGGDYDLYRYASDNPATFRDPSGTQFLAGCAGGALFNVGFDWASSALSGRKYTLTSALEDAAIGCAQGAVGAWLGELLGPVMDEMEATGSWLTELDGNFATDAAATTPRGLSGLGGVFTSEENAAGGTVWSSEGYISQNDVAPLVNSGLYRGDVNIITGVHGELDGTTTVEASFYEADVNRFGQLPGVKVYDFSKLTATELSDLLNGPGTTIGAFCNSGACLAPFR